MTQEHDERLERLVSRKLDDELSEDASLELDKRLIRDPAARQMLEDAARVDQLSSAFLADLCDGRHGASAARTGAARPRRRWWWMCVPAAAAACIVLLLFADGLEHHPSVGGTPGRIAQGTAPPRAPVGTVPVVRPHGRPQGKPQFAKWPVAEMPRVTDRQVNWYSVFDAARESLYVLEVKRTTRAQRQGFGSGMGNGGKVKLTSGEM